jgi:hypothetical protein
MIPARTKNALFNYVNHGVRPGGFLTAVLCNDLMAAVGHADTENLAALKQIVQYVYWEIPGACWGSRKRMNQWIDSRSSVAEIPQLTAQAGPAIL